MPYKDKELGREKSRLRSKKWGETHKKERHEYYVANKAKASAYYKSHKDEYKAYSRTYYLAHSKKLTAYQKEYRQTHTDYAARAYFTSRGIVPTPELLDMKNQQLALSKKIKDEIRRLKNRDE